MDQNFYDPNGEQPEAEDSDDQLTDAFDDATGDERTQAGSAGQVQQRMQFRALARLFTFDGLAGEDDVSYAYMMAIKADGHGEKYSDTAGDEARDAEQADGEDDQPKNQPPVLCSRLCQLSFHRIAKISDFQSMINGMAK